MNLEFIACLLLLGVTLFLSLLDRYWYGTWFSPIHFLAIPLTCIAFLAFFTGPSMGFVALNIHALFMIAGGIILFWIGSLPVLFIYGTPSEPYSGILFKKQAVKLNISKIEHFLILTSWFCSIMVMIRVFVLIRVLGINGWIDLASDDFTSDITAGIIGWLEIVLMIVQAILIGIYRWTLLNFLTVLTGVITLLIFQTKGVLFQAILAGVVFQMLSGRLILTTRKIILFTLGVVLFFIISYLPIVLNTGIDDLSIYINILRHIFDYLFSGILAFSEALRQETMDPIPGMLFGPLINLTSHLLGIYDVATRVSTLNVNFTFISDAPNGDSNVYTLFGTVILNSDPLTSVIYFIFLGTFLYFIYNISMRTDNIIITSIFSLIAARLIFGWFDNYFYQVAFLQTVILGFMAWLLTFLFSRSTNMLSNPTTNPNDNRLPVNV